MKKTLIILTLVALTLLAASCKTKEVPGRVRAPRHCNTCTKWSYVPKVEGIDTLVLPPMSLSHFVSMNLRFPTDEGGSVSMVGRTRYDMPSKLNNNDEG